MVAQDGLAFVYADISDDIVGDISSEDNMKSCPFAWCLGSLYNLINDTDFPESYTVKEQQSVIKLVNSLWQACKCCDCLTEIQSCLIELSISGFDTKDCIKDFGAR